MPAIRPEVLVILMSVIIGSIKLRWRLKFVKLLRSFILVALMSIAFSYTIHEVPYNFKDFMVIPMTIQYMVIFMFSYYIVSKVDLSFILRISILFYSLAGLMGILQIWNLFGINDWLTPLYFEEESSLTALQMGMKYGRALGTVGDPRHFALLLNLGFSSVLAQFHSSSIKKTFYAGLLAFFFVAIAATASRTGLILAFLLLVVSFYYFTEDPKAFIRYSIWAIILSPIFLYGFSELVTEGQKERLLDTESESYNVSFAARQRDNFEAFDRAKDNPLLLITGLGPAKSILPGSEHSDFGWFLIRFGFPGLIIYLIMLSTGFRISNKLLKYKNHIKDLKIVGLMGFLATVSWLVYAFAESIYKLDQIMSTILFYLGMTTYYYLNFGANLQVIRKRS